MLAIRELRKSYSTPQGEIEVLRGVSLDLSAGESLALMGESGSGKSTLLHLAAGLDKVDGGKISIDGKELGSLGDAERAEFRRRKIGLIFQQYNLIPSLTVRSNLTFQSRLAGKKSQDILGLAERLRISDMLDRYPEQLSGGQQQRVAIGRTLAARPPLIMADEPTGNLDEETSDDVIQLMLEIVSETNTALLLVTHSGRIAEKLSRREVLVQGRLA